MISRPCLMIKLMILSSGCFLSSLLSTIRTLLHLKRTCKTLSKKLMSLISSLKTWGANESTIITVEGVTRTSVAVEIMTITYLTDWRRDLVIRWVTQEIAAILAVTEWMETGLMVDATITKMAWTEIVVISLTRGHEEITTWAWVEVKEVIEIDLETITRITDNKIGCSHPHRHLTIETAEIADTLEAIPSNSQITIVQTQAIIIKMIRIRQMAQMAQIVEPLHNSRTRSNGLERLAAVHRMKRSSESALRDSGLSRRLSTNSNLICPVTRALQTLLARSQLTKRRLDAVIGLVAGLRPTSVSTCTQQSCVSSSQNASMATNAYTCTLKLNVNLQRTAPAWIVHTSTLPRTKETNQCRIWWWWALSWCPQWPCKGKTWCTKNSHT